MNNSDIKVSVIMPVYNARDFLSLAIDSVLSQTLREIELICIDDGSTDGSLDIIKEYQANDERVRIVTETNAGPAIARNNGIRRARGEYIAFLDADDFFEADLLEELYNAAEADGLDIALADYDVYNSRKATFEKPIYPEHVDIFKSGKVTSKSDYPDQIFFATNGSAWNKLFRTSFVREKELMFAPELYVFEDVHFVSCAVSLASRIAKIEKVLIHHRVYSDQSRAKLFRKYYAQVPVVYFKIKEFLLQHGNYVPLVRSFLNLSAGRCYKIYNLL
jgi:glycosyltransferase involved in cell wall biosynthesis